MNRNFIEDAARKALKKLDRSGILKSSPRLDKDTQDVPGIPDIANTILSKIQNASAILADVTYSGERWNSEERQPKLLPNPNVMLELGYALAELGTERIIHVLNTNYGKEEDLPFDLQNRRWPITFNLSPDASEEERKEQKTNLTKDLYRAIREVAQLPARQKKRSIEQRIQVLESLVAAISGNVAQIATLQENVLRIVDVLDNQSQTKRDPIQRCADLREALIKRILDSSFEGLSHNQGVLTLTIMPESEPEVPLPFHQQEDSIQLKLRPIAATGWNPRRYGDRFITYSGSRETEIDAVSEIKNNGIINAASHRVINLSKGVFHDLPEDVSYVPSSAFEKRIIEAVHSYLSILTKLTVPGPWYVAFGMINLKGSVLAVSPRYAFDGRKFSGNAILPSPVVVSSDDDIADIQGIARALRPAFDFVWREHNYPFSLNYSQTGEWVGQN